MKEANDFYKDVKIALDSLSTLIDIKISSLAQLEKGNRLVIENRTTIEGTALDLENHSVALKAAKNSGLIFRISFKAKHVLDDPYF